MRILMGMLVIGLLIAWSPAPTVAQPCEPSNCWGVKKAGIKAKAKKTAAIKKTKEKPRREQFMRY